MTRKPRGKSPGATPDYRPTEAEKSLVMIGTAAGVGEDYFCRVVGGGVLSREQFRAIFAQELAVGADGANLKVATNLFKMATAWPPIKGVTPTAAIFWLKSRAGWKEEPKVGGATFRMEEKGSGSGTEGAPDPARVIEVSFKIGDDSRIRDGDE